MANYFKCTLNNTVKRWFKCVFKKNHKKTFKQNNCKNAPNRKDPNCHLTWKKTKTTNTKMPFKRSWYCLVSNYGPPSFFFNNHFITFTMFKSKEGTPQQRVSLALHSWDLQVLSGLLLSSNTILFPLLCHYWCSSILPPFHYSSKHNSIQYFFYWFFKNKRH